jgi:hypothetical protein
MTQYNTYKYYFIIAKRWLIIFSKSQLIKDALLSNGREREKLVLSQWLILQKSKINMS